MKIDFKQARKIVFSIFDQQALKWSSPTEIEVLPEIKKEGSQQSGLHSQPSSSEPTRSGKLIK